MLTINTRNDKLAAAHVDFSTRGMLNGTCLGEAIKKHFALEGTTGSDNVEDDQDEDGDDGQDLDADEDDETGPVDGPTILSDVYLARKRGKAFFLHPQLFLMIS